MSLRTLSSLIGVCILLLLPTLSPDGALGVRITLGIVVSAAGIIGICAYVPAKWMVGFFRLAVGAFGAWMLAMSIFARTGPPADAVTAITELLAVFGCLFLAVGPWVRRGLRTALYGLEIAGCWLLLFELFQHGQWDFSLLIPVALFAYFSRLFLRWINSGRSTFVEGLEHLHVEARKVTTRFAEPWPVGDRIREILGRWQFLALMRLPAGGAMSERLYRRIRKACARYSATPLSWQIAYAAAIAIEDHKEAATLVLDAQALGFEEVMSDRMLAYALRANNDPTWKAVLSRGWQAESSRPNGWTKEAYYDLRGDPTAEWRETDAAFAALQKRLVATPPVPEPWLGNVTPISASG